MSQASFTISLQDELRESKNDVGTSLLSLPSNEMSANSDDVHAFHAALHDDPIANKIIGQVDQVSNAVAEKKLKFEMALKKATVTHDPVDIVNTARALSEYSLHTAIVTKVASKSSQAIQKLTSPQ